MQEKSIKKLKKNQLIFTDMEQLNDFQLFIKVNRLKQKQVAEYLGTSTQYINQVANGKCALSDDKYEMLAKSEWDISMLKIPSYIKVPAVSNGAEPNAIPIYGVQANIDTGQTSPKAPEPIPANAEIIPIVPSEVSGEMGIDIRKYVEKNADELDSIDPTKLLKNPDIAEQVAGTSMLPTFAPGDVVFIKFLPDKAKIIDGKTYYFDLKTLPTMIRKVKFEQGDRLRLVAKNPAFADITINRCDILNIGRVIGMFRQTFGDQYDEIEEVRRSKDEQISTMIKQSGDLIEQNGQALKIIRDLIKK